MKQIIARPAISILSMAVVLVVLELGTRLFFFQPLGLEGIPFMFRSSSVPDVVYEFVPQSSCEYRYGPPGPFRPPLVVPVRINGYGLRGAEITVEKRVDTVRIVAIGDSYTMGIGVREEDTYIEALGRDLRRTAPAGTNVETINAGVPGYNMVQEISWFQHRGVALNPDILIWGININDALIRMTFEVNLQGMLTSADATGTNPLVLMKPAGSRNLQDIILRHSHLARFVFKRKTNYLLAPPMKQYDFEALTPYVNKLVQTARGAGIQILALIMPILQKNALTQTDIREYFLHQCRLHDIPVIDILPLIDFDSITDYHVHPCDSHPDPATHRLFADVLSRNLKWRGNRLLVIKH
ncbi:SGNH/GDSL hydrolase family protein [bacterium]|nr:SGNH/GDSL hydrolase family protein [candidate division CSSED10-310 bacterium]